MKTWELNSIAGQRAGQARKKILFVAARAGTQEPSLPANCRALEQGRTGSPLALGRTERRQLFWPIIEGRLNPASRAERRAAPPLGPARARVCVRGAHG